MRLFLTNSQTEKVGLANELEALKLYVEMEAMRFEEPFEFNMSVSDSVNAEMLEIPPMILQPYVENAIWHGLSHKKTNGKLLLKVSRENGAVKFVIEDDGVGRKKAMQIKQQSRTRHKSLGMKITKDRLQATNTLYGSNAASEIIDLVDKNGKALGTRVVVRIPVQ
jgi:LytS/YehU family sensor histidine kinase